MVISTGLSPRIRRPSRDAAGVVDQGDVERGFQRAGGARRDHAGGDRQLRRKRLGHAAIGEARADGRADAAVNFCARDAVRAAESFEAAGKILVGPQPQREGAAGRFAPCSWRGTGPNSLKLVSGSGSAVNIAPSMPNASTSNGSATKVSSGSMWPPLTRPSASRPQPMAMKERRAVAHAERHGSRASVA